MKTLRPILLLALLAALAGAGGWWLTRPTPVEVVVHEVARGTVEATLTNTRAGEVEACQRAKMATIAGGRIEWLGVEEGDRVEAGQVLMRLWHGDLDARAAVVRAQLATARQRVQEAIVTLQLAMTAGINHGINGMFSHHRQAAIDRQLTA